MVTKIEDIWIKILHCPHFIFEWNEEGRNHYERCKQDMMKWPGYNRVFIVEFDDKNRRIVGWKRK